MKHLLIGGNGRVGSAVRARLEQLDADFIWTGRRDTEGYALDLTRQEDFALLPRADIIYLVAAVTSTITCEDDPRGTWHVNVDAPLAIARRYMYASFIVYVSSDAVEFCGHMEYGRQKAQVEAALALHPRVAIIRPGRINAPRAEEFARLLVNIGLRDEPGLFRWA